MTPKRYIHGNDFLFVIDEAEDNLNIDKALSESPYKQALKLVQEIDQHLKQGTKHYYTKGGMLLRTVDQVVHAILADNLRKEEASHDAQDTQ